MNTTKTRKSPVRSSDVGVLRIDERYTPEALKRRGFDGEFLRLARASKRVKPRQMDGKRLIYLGSELCEYIDQLPPKETA